MTNMEWIQFYSRVHGIAQDEVRAHQASTRWQHGFIRRKRQQRFLYQLSLCAGLFAVIWIMKIFA